MSTTTSSQGPNVLGSEAVIISAVFVALAGVFVVLRCFARFYLLRICGADDILIIFSITFSAAFAGMIEAQKQSGLGRHLDTLTADEQVETLKKFWASVIIYYLGLTTIKTSLLCQFLRFLIGSTIRRVCWTFLVIVALYGACTVLGSILACTPVPRFWDKANYPGYCINLLAFWFTNASFNIVSDIAIWTLPMPVLKSLQLPPKQKYSLIFVFALGGCACIISTIRLYSLYIVAHSTDVTWGNVGAAIWSSIELNVGIICACLPTLKPLVSCCLPKLLHSRQNDHVELRPQIYVQHSVDIFTDGMPLRSQDMVHHLDWKDEERALVHISST